jgi:C-terminal processing protease CtpA/Prc
MFSCCASDEDKVIEHAESTSEGLRDQSKEENVVMAVHALEPRQEEKPSPAPAVPDAAPEESRAASAEEPEKKEELAPAPAPALAPAPAPEVFTIELDNAAGKVGMVVDLSDEYLIITEIQPGGLADSWNKACKPDEVINKYDRIRAVSGKTGKAGELKTLLGEKTRLKVEIAHSRETSVSLPREEKKLGLKLSALRLGTHVMEVTSGGRIEDWNQANPAIVIKPGHRIMKVDDVEGSGAAGGQALFDSVQAKAKTYAALELKFLSWP